MKRFAVGVLVFLLTVGLVFPGAAVAGPPDHAGGPQDHARGAGPPGDSDGHPHGGPPGLSSDAPPVLQDNKEDDDNGAKNGDGDEETDAEGRTPPGLVDKGGLPPGLQGRSVDELPPGIRYNPNFQEAINKMREKEETEEPVVAGISILGETKVAVPGENDVTYEYEAKTVDEDNEIIERVAAEWEWKIEEDEIENGTGVEGVEVETDDGMLKLLVGSDAEPGTIIEITATADVEVDEETKVFDDSIKVELYSAEVDQVKIEGKKHISLTGIDEGDNFEVTYEAYVKDQQGHIMEDEKVEWVVSCPEDYSDFAKKKSVDDQNRLTVEVLQEEGKFFVLAESETDSDIWTEILVTVYQQEIAEIKILGEEYVTLDDSQNNDNGENGQDSVFLDYEARVLDNEGQVMEEKVVDWSVEEVQGFNTDEITKYVDDNYITVELPGEPGEFTLVAELEDSELAEDLSIDTASLTVYLYYPEPDSVEVSGADTITIPEEDNEDVEKEYYAVLKDQKDQEMEEKEFSWALVDKDDNDVKLSIPGVSLDYDGDDSAKATLTVADDAGERSFALQASYEENGGEVITGIFDVKLVENADEE